MYFSGHVTIPGNAEEQMLFLALPLLMMTAFPCLKTLLHYSLNHIMSSIRINLKLLSSSPCSYLNCMSFPLSFFLIQFSYFKSLITFNQELYSGMALTSSAFPPLSWTIAYDMRECTSRREDTLSKQTWGYRIFPFAWILIQWLVSLLCPLIGKIFNCWESTIWVPILP